MGTQKHNKFRQNRPESVQQSKAASNKSRSRFFADEQSDDYDGDDIERDYRFRDEKKTSEE